MRVIRPLAQDLSHGALPVLYAIAGLPGNSFAGPATSLTCAAPLELIDGSAAARAASEQLTGVR